MHTDKAGDDKHQCSDNATIAMNLEDAQEWNCIKKDEQGSAFSPSRKKHFQSSIMSKCGTHPCGTKKRTFAGHYPVRGGSLDSPNGNLKGTGKEMSKDRNMEIALNGPRRVGVREELRAASSTILKKGEELYPVLLPTRRGNTQKETEEEIPCRRKRLLTGLFCFRIN